MKILILSSAFVAHFSIIELDVELDNCNCVTWAILKDIRCWSVNKLFQDKILKFPEAQHPVVLQLGGNKPEKLFKAAQLASSYKYDEINLK